MFKVTYTKTFVTGNLEGLSVPVSYSTPDLSRAKNAVQIYKNNPKGKDYGTKAEFVISNPQWTAA